VEGGSCLPPEQGQTISVSFFSAVGNRRTAGVAGHDHRQIVVLMRIGLGVLMREHVPAADSLAKKDGSETAMLSPAADTLGNSAAQGIEMRFISYAVNILPLSGSLKLT
jgi:hypothetical protein